MRSCPTWIFGSKVRPPIRVEHPQEPWRWSDELATNPVECRIRKKKCVVVHRIRNTGQDSTRIRNRHLCYDSVGLEIKPGRLYYFSKKVPELEPGFVGTNIKASLVPDSEPGSHRVLGQWCRIESYSPEDISWSVSLGILKSDVFWIALWKKASALHAQPWLPWFLIRWLVGWTPWLLGCSNTKQWGTWKLDPAICGWRTG